LPWEDLVFKRLIDIAFSLMLLVVALPVLVASALIVKLDSPGPVLFLQERMGRGFRRFRLYKLRTMNLRGDGPAYTLGADPRITRAGRWLRKFKIDELPQLWNVLRGDMSLVGPRPVIPALAIEFDCAYARLLKVRPGLTDPASVKYCNETEILGGAVNPMRYFKSVVTPDKIRISQEYLERATAWTDLCMMAATAAALLSPEIRAWLSGSIPAEQERFDFLLQFPRALRPNKVQPIFERSSKAGSVEIPVAVIERSRRPRAFPGGQSASG
jgi:lipopolysaccharide/colanic/teichoic acid biosynthesis glycosyltransferase